MIGSGDCELEIVSRLRSRLIEDLLGEGARPLADCLEDVPRRYWALAARVWMEMTGEGNLPIPDTVAEGSEEVGDFGPYRLIRELGRGGQGSVHLAEDLRLGRQVALKVLEGWASSSELAIRRLRREAEVASKVDDPGICTVYETGVESGTPFIAMRYVEGQSLAQRIVAARKAAATRAVGVVTTSSENGSSESEEEGSSGSTSRRGREAVLEVVALIEKVARSLHAAHEAGILHRDIKPGNIMVSPSGDPVITDFGIARQRDSEQPALTRSGDIVGTPAYLSPEQLGGRAHDLDRRSDVWALGVTLYECLTLQRPFAAPTREGLYRAIEGHEPPDPRKLNRAIPEDLRVVLHVALEKDRDRRYQTALDFAEELRRVRQSEPIHARRAGPMLRLARWARRQPAVAASLSALFLVLIAGMAVSLFLKAEADRNLHSWRRMADVRLLDDLLREADEELWPAFPEKIAAMEAWLERADDLLGRRDRHEATLAGLRAAARPYTEIDRERDRREHPLAEALLGAQHRLEHLRGEIERSVTQVGELAGEIRDLEDEGGARARRQLVRTEQRHDALLEEIEDLRSERRSLIEKTAAWSEEIASA